MTYAPQLQQVLFAATWIACSHAVFAQSPATSASTLSVFDVLAKRAEADLSVPASPAFAVLGLTPTSIQRPGTVRDLMAAVSKGFDKDGRVKSGLALDVAPMSLFAQERIVGGDRYASDPTTQVFARTTVSLATAETAGASQLAWGIRMGLIDLGDPGLYAADLAKCVRRSPALFGDMNASPTTDGPSEDQQAKTKGAVAGCAPGKQFALWAKPALYVGLGQSWYSGSGLLKDRSPAVKVYWATYSVGQRTLGHRTLLQLHAERRSDDRVADPMDATKLLRQDTTSLIARVKLGAERWNGYADLGRNRMLLAGANSDSTRYRGLGMELRLRDDLWLQAGRSMERGFADGRTVSKVLTSIRIGKEPVLAAGVAGG